MGFLDSLKVLPRGWVLIFFGELDKKCLSFLEGVGVFCGFKGGDVLF